MIDAARIGLCFALTLVAVCIATESQQTNGGTQWTQNRLPVTWLGSTRLTQSKTTADASCAIRATPAKKSSGLSWGPFANQSIVIASSTPAVRLSEDQSVPLAQRPSTRWLRLSRRWVFRVGSLLMERVEPEGAH